MSQGVYNKLWIKLQGFSDLSVDMVKGTDKHWRSIGGREDPIRFVIFESLLKHFPNPHCNAEVSFCVLGFPFIDTDKTQFGSLQRLKMDMVPL